MENCQIGVFPGLASPKGHALTDRRLHLPKEWIEDTERRKAASIPGDARFAAKQKIGIAMVEAAHVAGVPCSWVLGYSVHGSDKGLRVMCISLDLI
ncbi:MAG: transposase [Beijerinckiaceae bacterium]